MQVLGLMLTEAWQLERPLIEHRLLLKTVVDLFALFCELCGDSCTPLQPLERLAGAWKGGRMGYG